MLCGLSSGLCVKKKDSSLDSVEETLEINPLFTETSLGSGILYASCEFVCPILKGKPFGYEGEGKTVGGKGNGNCPFPFEESAIELR